MEFTGLMLGYKKNRPLTDEERINQLNQKEPLEVPLNYDLCVIKLNSTFMETVDRYYAWRGILTLVTGVFLLMLTVTYGGFIFIAVGRWGQPKGESDVAFLLFVAVLFLPTIGILLWIALKENFTYTHFPIRLNRKTRKVYVFRPGRLGRPILSADWDKLFFCVTPCPKSIGPGRSWDIRAHVLADDGVTVLDTFAFDMVADEGDLDAGLRGHWEFLRRYMEDEDGPKQAHELVGVCMPVAEHRETLRFSLNRFYVNFMGGRWLWYGLLPFWLLCIVGRIVSMWTSRVPKWPESIEAECRIEPNDPYIKNEHTNLKKGFYAI